MNKCTEIQNKIKLKYPNFKSLPFLTRIKIRITLYPSTCTDSFESGFEKYSQTYKTYFYNGQEYFYKFGW